MLLGGAVPGSLPNGVSSIFEDGVQILPVKIMSAGKMNEGIADMMFRNCGMPDWNRW